MEKLILECVVRSALVAVCMAAVLYVLGVKAARVRHAVWASVVGLMLLLPVWTAWGPKAVLRVLRPAPVVVSVQSAIETTPSDVAAPIIRQSTAWTWRNWLAAAYLLGLCGLLARLGIGTVRARLLVLRARNREGRLTSDSCVSPITVGWLHPAVILPVGWMQWPQWQLEAVLAHEGEHARRRDPLVQWLALLNRAVFWFHPLAWWLSRQLCALAEEACDDAVLVSGHDPVRYSECLLGLARMVGQAGVRMNVAGMAMPGAFLPRRIRRIVAGTTVQRVSRGRMVCVAAAGLVVSTVFVAGAVGYAPAAVGPEVGAQSSGSAPVSVALPLPDSRGSEGAVVTVGDTRAQPALRKKTTVLIAQAQASPVYANSFVGTVVDPSNTVVANAQVTLTDTDTAVSSSTTTDNAGQYRFQNITPGTYQLAVQAPGFKRLTQTGIHVAAGEARNGGTMFLQIGSIATSATVAGSKSAPVPTAPPANQPGIDEERRQFVEQFWLRRDPGGATAIVGVNVQPSRLINAIRPAYPLELQIQGVQGTVKIEAVVTKEGLVGSLRVASSPDPGLTQAALDAVRQWRYQPTLLNGQPVEVMTMIDVTFQLND